ncbi:hypothetical protein [Bdellovibrio bacteriovorus]|uniref:hypothetical protein n=1 Tax=Bdellovibrio bacteriovorus TaxID=959 RepID=UPI003AA91111
MWKYLYIFIGLMWVWYYLSLGGGEAGIVPFYITTALTFPIGLLVWLFGHLFPWELIVPSMLVLNYFQWNFIAGKFRRFKAR